MALGVRGEWLVVSCQWLVVGEKKWKKIWRNEKKLYLCGVTILKDILYPNIS